MKEMELDALVAEKVMGWKYWQSKHGHWIVDDPQGRTFEPGFGAPHFDQHSGEKITYPWWYNLGLPGYSTDIAAAWQVVEKMAATGFALLLDGNLHGQYTAAFTKGEPDGTGDEFVTAESAPLAICKAALAATKATEKK